MPSEPTQPGTSAREEPPVEFTTQGPVYGMDPDTGEMWEYADGEAWQGPLQAGSVATVTDVDHERGVITFVHHANFSGD